MKIRLLSDLHLDSDVHQYSSTHRQDGLTQHDMLYYPQPLSDDLETTLVLAGDIWEDRKFLTNKHSVTGKSWLAIVASRFKYVVFVLGNHDYWGTNITTEIAKCKQEIIEQGIDNAFLLEDSVVVLDNVKFIGATLWTDYNRGIPHVLYSASQTMNDYKYIRQGVDYHKCRPEYLYEKHLKSRRFIFENSRRDYGDQNVVVVTHMAPSYQSVVDGYRTASNAMCNYYYYSDLDNYFYDENVQIDLWCHGHMHTPLSYKIASTSVVCNPRGYYGQDTNYHPTLTLDI